MHANFEGLKGLFLFGLLFCIRFAAAQDMYFAANPRMTPAYTYSKVVGENAGGIYVMKYRDADIRRHFTLERYSHSLEFIDEQDYSLDKHDRLLKVFTRDSGMVFIIARKNKTITELLIYRLGFDIKKEPLEKSIGSAGQAESLEDIRCEYSINRQWCGIWVECAESSGKQRLNIFSFNLNSGFLYTKTISTPFDWKNTGIDEGSVGNHGETLCALLHEDNVRRLTDPASQQYVVYSTDTGKAYRSIELNAGKFFISGLELNRDEFAGKFVVCGFYDYKNAGAAHGFFTLQVSTDTQQLHFEAFDRKLVASLIGAKDEEKGLEPEHFFIRKMVPRDDGGILVIAENYYVSQQLETFYLNGVPQTSSRNVYNYNDLLFIAIDSAGQAEWNYVHRKRQSSFANGSYYHSIGVYVCDSNVNLVYNENASQSNRVVHLRLDRDGRLEQKILFNSESAYTAIVPFEGKQTGYNRYVVPLLREKQTSLLKLVQTH